MTTTQCWNCQNTYSIELPICPHCSGINANVDPDGVQVQTVAMREGLAAIPMVLLCPTCNMQHIDKEWSICPQTDVVKSANDDKNSHNPIDRASRRAPYEPLPMHMWQKGVGEGRLEANTIPSMCMSSEVVYLTPEDLLSVQEGKISSGILHRQSDEKSKTFLQGLSYISMQGVQEEKSRSARGSAEEKQQETACQEAIWHNQTGIRKFGYGVDAMRHMQTSGNAEAPQWDVVARSLPQDRENSRTAMLPVQHDVGICGGQYGNHPERSGLPSKASVAHIHESHQCHGCGTVWRPASIATIGVRSVDLGKRDTWRPGQYREPHELFVQWVNLHKKEAKRLAGNTPVINVHDFRALVAGKKLTDELEVAIQAETAMFMASLVKGVMGTASEAGEETMKAATMHYNLLVSAIGRAHSAFAARGVRH